MFAVRRLPAWWSPAGGNPYGRGGVFPVRFGQAKVGRIGARLCCSGWGVAGLRPGLFGLSVHRTIPPVSIIASSPPFARQTLTPILCRSTSMPCCSGCCTIRKAALEGRLSQCGQLGVADRAARHHRAEFPLRSVRGREHIEDCSGSSMPGPTRGARPCNRSICATL